jgi:hypothetical protein
MGLFSFPFAKGTLLSCAVALAAAACAPNLSGGPLLGRSSSPVRVGAQSQQSPLRTRFVTQATVPTSVFQKTLAEAQAYSDLISKRRDLDLFKLHPQAVGLQLNDHSYILSFLGTAATRNDLNVELRAMVGDSTGMNLNYSGPVTRSTAAQIEKSSLQRNNVSPASADAPLKFELITGLPAEHITNAYGDQLERLGQYLHYRFQAQPITFDDGPLIYALNTPQDELLGFVFFNQRNILTLGERKYADVQSVVLVDTQGEVQGAYTVVAFNPKTTQANSALNYQIETPEDLGQLALLGEF